MNVRLQLENKSGPKHEVMLCEKLTQLIVCISDAYSVDEIQLLVEDLFGRDALDETFRDETIERALNG